MGKLPRQGPHHGPLQKRTSLYSQSAESGTTRRPTETSVSSLTAKQKERRHTKDTKCHKNDKTRHTQDKTHHNKDNKHNKKRYSKAVGVNEGFRVKEQGKTRTAKVKSKGAKAQAAMGKELFEVLAKVAHSKHVGVKEVFTLGTDFSGLETPSRALRNVGVAHRLVFCCESRALAHLDHA